ncbi:fibronectin type III domain-containing protein [Flavobacterium sp. PLA-1-15]|uniref:fibronectin type III domain-containing protein n=1 Tax=Flavobacterium sp. PLA-1-15 TaxID=3380533 RepID=UPI003B7635B5
MKKNYSLKRRACIVLCLFFVVHLSFGQTTTVFNDDFTTPVAPNYTIVNGPISGSGTWTMVRSGANFGSAIGNGRMQLTNTAATSLFNYSGWVLGSTSSSSFAAPYNTILANNPGAVTWTFNLRQSRTNPSGFAASGYGAAFILAGTAGSTNLTGSGYAVILGNSTSIDPIRLVRYTSGIRNYTNLLASSTTGLTDFGTQYLSVKVVYTPTTNTWQLFVRNDGTTAFADPNSGTLTAQGSVVNNASTGTSLPMLGVYWNAGTVANQTAFFDNVRVTVGVPFITSIAPNSKIAGTGSFTITVNGQNFSNTSVVQWNGSNRTTTYVSPTQLTANITAADIITSGTALVTVANGTTISNSNIFTIDPAGVPTLTTSTAAINLATNVAGTPSAATTYTITGANLTADPVTITAPANLELSRDGVTYATSLVLTRSGNTLTGQPVTIYVRTRATATAGIYNTVITNTAPGAVTKTITVNATVLAAQPTSNATAINFTNITSTSFTVNWTNSGNGARRLVLIRQAGAVNSLPVDGQSYTASQQFGTGSEIGTGNYVFYSGTGTSATVTGLNPSTIYHVSVVEYNGTTSGIENYATSGLTGNTTTAAIPLGWQINAVNTVNTITFDATVDGVNNDVFQADGVSATAQVGQLSSRAWAFTGFSDGNVAFLGTSAEDSDYDQGASEGGVSEGGLYAFETQPDNFSLGIQPAAGDFAPGTVTLRFQNRTGATMTTLNVGYKVYVYNDQPSSSNFNFSHSINNSAYTAVPTLNVVSPAAADMTPGWKAYYRVTTITGLSIPVGSDYFLRWESATVSGSVDFDEFALDDISVVINPVANFVPFSGTAESFVLNGNATLSGNVEVVGNLNFTGNAKLGIASNTLTSNGSITNTTQAGIRGSGTSNLVIGGTQSNTLSFDQTTVGTTNLLNNLTIATSSNTTTVGNALAVNGTLNIAADQVLDMGTNALTGTLVASVVNGTLQTANTSTTPLPTGKTWSGNGTVHYNSATTAQTVVAGTYNGLTVSSTGGAVAGGALTVNGTLNLPTANPSATLGSFSTGTFELLMGAVATNTGIGDVTGIVTRNTFAPNVLYTFGHEHTSILFPSIGTLPTSMGLKIQIGTAPTWRTGAIQRIYDLRQTGGNNTKAIIKAHYKDSELNGNVEARLVDIVHFVAANNTLEQGRSNYNTTENWVELTNVNVGLVFQTAFDLVKLTLDEATASVLTWNGSLSDSWTTAANWTPNGTPSDNTTVIIPDAATTPNDPLINNPTLVGSVNILAGGIVNTPVNSQMTVNNGAGAWINNGNYVASTGNTVTFTNLDATIAGTTNFRNITIPSGAGLRPLTGNTMRISGVFTRVGIFSPGAVENTVEFNGSVQTIPSLTTGLAAYNNLIISGTSANIPTTLNVTGNLTLNEAVDFTGKTVVMKGSTPQTIGGTVSSAFNNLIIENTNGNVNLGFNVAVNATLTLNSGQLIVNNRLLILSANPVAGTFNASSMIVTEGTGVVRKQITAVGSYFFPIGENTTPAYSPIQVSIDAATISGYTYIDVAVADGIHPENNSLQNHLSRYWRITPVGLPDAIATINATYLSSDLSADISTIAAGQLAGSLNPVSNPWRKYNTLTGTSLAVAGAPLTQGVPNYFTGIKAEPFTVEITGFGAFCEDQPVTLLAATSGGDGAYTYIWSDGLGSQATATPPTALAGTENYSVTVIDANGFVATDDGDITVLTESLGGSLSGSQIVCLRTAPDPIALTGYTGNVLYWQRSESPTFASGITNLSNFTDVLTSENAGLILATTYFRAVISNGNCGEVYSTITSAIINSTTWDGTSWSNGFPAPNTNVVVTGDTTLDADFIACSVTIENNADIIVASDISLTINGALIINSGSLTVEDDGSLVQTNNTSQNSGTNFTMKRITEPMYRYDLTYWSSPVANQTLKNLSPLTLFDKYFGWDSNSQTWITYPVGNRTMQAGAGYVVRAPQNYATDPTDVQPYTGNFIGMPHNGIYTIPVVGDGNFNLLGNPYPSAIDADLFLSDPDNANLDGVIYLWTHNTPLIPAGQIYSYSTDDYAVYNFLGGTGTAAPSEPDQALNVPNGYIAAGQGFFIGGLTAGTATFKNEMRVGGNNNQFFRSPQEEKHRLWASISNASGGFKQILIGHSTNATNDFDRGWDGSLMDADGLTLYTFVEDKKLSIQSFALPFDVNQIVPVGYKTNTAGSHSIMLNKTDGLFDQQDIYLHDKELNVVHDLKASNYEFNTQSGTFNDRFEIVYVNAALGTPDNSSSKGILIYNDEKTVNVKSSIGEIRTVRIIDMQGRILYTLDDVNDNQAFLKLDLPNQVLIVSVTTKDGLQFNKKIIQ